jgi:putative ABC transport system substrate-binding protein
MSMIECEKGMNKLKAGQRWSRCATEPARARRRGDRVKRREFITLLGGAAAWPLAARAQQAERMRRIGVLMRGSADDSDEQARLTAFLQGLQEWGWSDGRNVHIEVRWSAADSNRRHRYAAELVAPSPDVILADTSAVVAALQQATQTVPIVFAGVIDPVGAGFVANLARPGGNTTGCPAPTACGLSFSLSRFQWRADLLRS